MSKQTNNSVTIVRWTAALLCLLVPSLCAQTQQELVEARRELLVKYEKAGADLRSLTAELEAAAETETDLEVKRDYVDRVLALLEDLRILKQDIEFLGWRISGRTPGSTGGATGGPPVFDLVEIIGRRPKPFDPQTYKLGVEYQEGAAGFTVRSTGKWTGAYDNKDDRVIVTQSQALVDFPEEFTLGQPFEISGEVRAGVHYTGDGWRGCEEGGSPRNTTITAGVRGMSAQFRGKADLQALCSEVRLNPHPSYKHAGVGQFQKNDAFRFRIRYVPNRVREQNGVPRWFYYETEVTSDGDIVRQPRGPAQILDAALHNAGTPQVLRIGLLFGISDSITLEYQTRTAGATRLAGIPKFRHPDYPPPGQQPGEAGVSGGAGAVVAGGGGGGDVGASGGASGPVTPAGVQPSDSDIARHIAQWIAIAEPPANATEGARLRYTPRGVMVGRTGNGTTIEARHETGSMDPVHLWNNMRKLDSVNDCTMEEYVIASVNGYSIDHCRGRYRRIERAQVPVVAGMSLPNAVAAIEAAGLKVKMVAGPEASRPEQERTIHSQNPRAGSAVAPGGSVEVSIYTTMARLRVPSLVGLTAEQAKQALQQVRLQAVTYGMENTRSAEVSGTVGAQSPSPGMGVAPNDAVQIGVFEAFVAPVRTAAVPNVIGKSLLPAEIALRVAGVEVQVIRDTNGRGRPGTVIAQDPQPGVKIQKGGTARIWVAEAPTLGQILGDGARVVTPAEASAIFGDWKMSWSGVGGNCKGGKQEVIERLENRGGTIYASMFNPSGKQAMAPTVYGSQKLERLTDGSIRMTFVGLKKRRTVYVFSPSGGMSAESANSDCQLTAKGVRGKAPPAPGPGPAPDPAQWRRRGPVAQIEFPATLLGRRLQRSQVWKRPSDGWKLKIGPTWDASRRLARVNYGKGHGKYLTVDVRWPEPGDPSHKEWTRIFACGSEPKLFRSSPAPGSVYQSYMIFGSRSRARVEVSGLTKAKLETPEVRAFIKTLLDQVEPSAVACPE